MARKPSPSTGEPMAQQMAKQPLTDETHQLPAQKLGPPPGYKPAGDLIKDAAKPSKPRTQADIHSQTPDYSPSAKFIIDSFGKVITAPRSAAWRSAAYERQVGDRIALLVPVPGSSGEEAPLSGVIVKMEKEVIHVLVTMA